MKQGAFIVFEGADGSGKSEQSKRAYIAALDWVAEQWPTDPEDPELRNGPAVHLVKEPGNPDVRFCREIREMIFKREYSDGLDAVQQGLLFFIDHYTNGKFVAELLARGDIVICDRWCYSQYAYDVAKKSSQVDALKLYRQYEPLQVQPDLVVLMDAEPELLVKRLEARGTTKDVSQEQKRALWGDKTPLDAHTLVRNAYLRMATDDLLDPNRVRWEVITQSEEDTPATVFKRVWGKLLSV